MSVFLEKRILKKKSTNYIEIMEIYDINFTEAKVNL